MTAINPTDGPRRRPIPRRLLVQGGAWSVPAVVIASAAPAHAVSGQKVTVRRTGSGIDGESSILGFGPRGTTTYPDTITAGGGTGAVPPNPGAGSTVHTQSGNSVGGSLLNDGNTGGVVGSGFSGGGNGAGTRSGTLTWTAPGNAQMSVYISSGSGGGGYGGGGSGAIAAYQVTTNYPGEGPVYTDSAVGGAGGAGGDFVAASLGCVINTSTAPAPAANGGSGGQHGGQGYVEVVYYL